MKRNILISLSVLTISALIGGGIILAQIHNDSGLPTDYCNFSKYPDHRNDQACVKKGGIEYKIIPSTPSAHPSNQTTEPTSPPAGSCFCTCQ